MGDYLKGGNLYNKYESKNPLVKYIVNKYMKCLTLMVKKCNPSSILEVGCGEGYILKHLNSELEVDIVGVDLYRDVLELAKKKTLIINFIKEIYIILILKIIHLN